MVGLAKLNWVWNVIEYVVRKIPTKEILNILKNIIYNDGIYSVKLDGATFNIDKSGNRIP